MKLFFALFLFFSISYLGSSQTILLERQGQVDSFICASNIHSIQIGFAIKDSDIHDISKLACIQSLWGAGLVVVNNPHLKSLNGLQNIHSIKGALIIKNNDSLTNLIGLPTSYNCTEPTDYWRYVHISQNANLKSLEGFPYVANLDNVAIGAMDSLKNLNFLPHLEGLNKLSIAINRPMDLANLIAYDTIPEKLFIAGNGFISLHGLDSLKFCQEIILKNVNNIVNLEGLGNLDSVRTFTIESCDKLQNFAGLNNLRAVYSLEISENNALQNFGGIENTDKIERIKIINNPALINLTGLDSLKLMKSFVCKDNPNLISIDELSAQVTDELKIENCNNLQHINKTHGAATWRISIKNNPRLKNYGPFPNVIPFNSQNIEITYNDSLASVEGLMGLKRVESTFSNDGRLYLRNNPLLPNLNGLDSLKYTEYISFRFTNVSTLSPLSHLDSIGFTLFLHNELGNLKTLDGLQNISSIKSGFAAYNKNLKDLSALFESNTNVGRLFILSCDSLMPSLNIHNLSGLNYIDISSNPTLETITGLENIDSLHETFLLRDNKKLQIFSALKNLQFLSTSNSPGKLHTNPNLTDISGLCHLFTEGTIAGTIDIHDNAAGFNSQQEIIEWCMTPTIDLPTWDAIAVYPNPTADAFFVDVPMDLIQVGMMVDLVDISGVSHFSARIKDSVSSIPVGNLAPGLYFLRIVFDGRLVQVKKVLVER